MTLAKVTGTIRLDGNEDPLFVIGQGAATLHSFQAMVNLKTMLAGDAIQINAYSHYDGPSQWKFDGDVNDAVGSNNGTITYNSNLNALYKFQNNLNDSSSNAYNLSLGAGAASYVSGPESYAIQFNGSTYFTASSSAVVTGSGNRSISFWLKTPSTFTSNTYLFCYGVNSAETLFGASWTSSGSTSTITFQGGSPNTLGTTTVFSANTWYYITLVISGGSGKVCTWYVNGVSDSTTTFGTGLNTTSSTFYLGSYLGGSDFSSSGTCMAEFRIYNSALSSAQVSALYMVGEVGQSHTFDGGEYITASDSNLPIGNNAFSILAWIKPTTTNAYFSVGGWGIPSPNECLQFYINNANRFVVDNDSIVLYASTATISSNVYTHILLTYNGTTLTIYLNGVLDGSVNISPLNLTSSGSTGLTIGKIPNGATPFATGQIDDLRIYNRALAASEVSDLYSNPAQEMKALVYSVNYYGPQTVYPFSPFIYLPYISSIQYAVTCTQMTGVPYKNIYWEYETIT